MKTQSIYRVVLILGMNLVCLGSVSAQGVEEADRLYEGESWAAAADAYQRFAESEPTNARAWFRLGVSLRHLGRYEEAVGAFGKAEENGTPVTFVSYQLAATYALRGDKELAFEWIDKALEAGFSQPEGLVHEEAFAGLREDARFQQALERADINARPCELLPEYGELDFWVGHWDVFSGGQAAGTNHIEKTVNGCILLEDWTGASGGTGKSFNYYDPGKRRWVQIWIDSEGGVIQAEGGLADGTMVLSGRHVYRNGNEEEFRMTFTPLDDGSVRQFIEQSKDKGKSWYVWFDGTYRKQN